MEKSRLYWVDNAKVVACILVVLGHFFMGLQQEGLIKEGTAYTLFVSIIYSFHVQLFFLCSGFLYQKFFKINNINSYKYNITKKAFSLLIPYFTFCILAFILKSIIGKSKTSIIDSLFVNPSPPFWYLLVLFIFFAIIPTIKNIKTSLLLLIISTVIYIAYGFFANDFFTPIPIVSSILNNIIWFLLGVNLAVFKEEKILKKPVCLLFPAFLIIKTILHFNPISNIYVDFTLSVIIVFIALIGIAALIFNLSKKDRQSKFFSFFIKYTMPIYLMHTIFGAAIRTLLIKVGITSILIHIPLGLVFEFLVPIIAYNIMKKVKLDFFIFPLRYIKLNKSNL